VLAALPAADGIAALLLDRLKQRLVRTGKASRRIYAPAADLKDEELAAVEKPLDHAEREAIGREMVRSAGALERVEQEAVRWVLAISAVFLLAEIWSLDFYPFLPLWAPTVFASLTEASITLLIGWYAWRLFETGLAGQIEPRRGRSAEPLPGLAGDVPSPSLIMRTKSQQNVKVNGLNAPPRVNCREPTCRHWFYNWGPPVRVRGIVGREIDRAANRVRSRKSGSH
jgi:hypothetical protein